MDNVIDDIYGGKYKPKTNLKLGKVCKKGDIICENRRKTYFSSIAKMKNPSCPDGSFAGIPSQSLRNLVGNLGIRKRKNQPKKTLCAMLKDYENKNRINIMKFKGIYKKPPQTFYRPDLGLNYVLRDETKSNLPNEIDPIYRSYDYLYRQGNIKEIPQWLKDDRTERAEYKAKGLKRPKNIKRKRGRPAKIIEEIKEEKPKRPRGRPRKNVEEIKPILQPLIKTTKSNRQNALNLRF